MYLFNICIDTPSVTEELSFNTVDVTIKGETTTVDIGEIRLHPSDAAPVTRGCGDYVEQAFVGSFSPVTEYNNITNFHFHHDSHFINFWCFFASYYRIIL